MIRGKQSPASRSRVLVVSAPTDSAFRHWAPPESPRLSRPARERDSQYQRQEANQRRTCRNAGLYQGIARVIWPGVCTSVCARARACVCFRHNADLRGVGSRTHNHRIIRVITTRRERTAHRLIRGHLVRQVPLHHPTGRGVGDLIPSLIRIRGAALGSMPVPAQGHG